MPVCCAAARACTQSSRRRSAWRCSRRRRSAVVSTVTAVAGQSISPVAVVIASSIKGWALRRSYGVITMYGYSSDNFTAKDGKRRSLHSSLRQLLSQWLRAGGVSTCWPGILADKLAVVKGQIAAASVVYCWLPGSWPVLARRAVICGLRVLTIGKASFDAGLRRQKEERRRVGDWAVRARWRALRSRIGAWASFSHIIFNITLDTDR